RSDGRRDRAGRPVLLSRRLALAPRAVRIDPGRRTARAVPPREIPVRRGRPAPLPVGPRLVRVVRRSDPVAPARPRVTRDPRAYQTTARAVRGRITGSSSLKPYAAWKTSRFE